MKMRSVGIVGTGIYVPEEIRTNDWFKQFDLLPFDDLFDNAGVMKRRVCAKGEKSSDMETKALLAAVENAGISIEDVELILDGPNLHDQPQPGNAALVQYKSGAKNAAAINVESACTSLLSQITIAWALIRSGMYNTIACIGASNWTVTADYTEKNCMFLGDGAAALIMQPVSDSRGIVSTHLETDGSCWSAVGRNFRLPRALIENYRAGSYLEGPREKVFFYIDRGDSGIEKIRRYGPTKIPEAAKKALAKTGNTEKDIDFLILHNPTQILVDTWQKALDVPDAKMHVTIEKYGNMSAASIGANLHEAVTMGKIKDGDLVVMCGPGAGFHYSAVVMRWGK
ncbi:MAG: 3-oxoacyl-ACP synthase III family protein [Nitrospirae bacterium]|nr:3-oxoacyl-ACP synthase III family protein [Nitrospirota bacterium]MDA8215663.1 3-oxoacyl-ACP synthase III family protein [Nitrospiraceae bacterium]